MERSRSEMLSSNVKKLPTGKVLIKRLDEMEKAYIKWALDNSTRGIEFIAEQLGIGRATLYRKIRHYGLQTKLETRLEQEKCESELE